MTGTGNASAAKTGTHMPVEIERKLQEDEL